MFFSKKSRNSKSNNTGLRAGFESLEDKRLMTAVGSNFFPGLPVHIYGSHAADTINIVDHGSGILVSENGHNSWFFAPSSITIYANGGDDVIDKDTAIPATIYGGNGNDLFYSGNGSDTMYGENGNDTIVGEGGNDIVYGGAGNDWIHGGNGSDTLHGGGGNDVIYGAEHRDRIFGEWGNDSLFGNGGDDDLYGGGGADSLFGGTGDDGLFGGAQGDNDDLYGQQGDDRFLVAGADRVRDEVARDDAIIRFNNGAAQTIPLTGFGNVSFAAGNWTDAEIQNVDVALRNLHHHVGNTTLLETANGGRITFERIGNQITTGSSILGWNGGSNIAFTNATFGDDLELYQTVYHEIGHNWDDPGENSFINDFRNISDWTQGQPTITDWYWTWSCFCHTRQTHVDTNYAQAGDGSNWYHRNPNWFAPWVDGFARNYGKWNPNEDYATTWETYFADRYHGSTDGNMAVPAKYANLDRLFASLR